MSQINNLNESSNVFEPEIETSVRHDDVKKKFAIYRSNTEQINAKYREAKEVIDRLKEEMQISREMEKSQRIRISSLQSRITIFEEKWKKLHEISEKQRNNSDEIQRINSSIISITKLIQDLKEKFQAAIITTVNEMNVIRENRELQSILEAKDIELDILKNELQSVICEKEDLVKKHETEKEELQREIEITKTQANGTKEYSDNMINKYEQKIREYKRVIDNMEKERKIILDDYDMGSTLESLSNSMVTGNFHVRAETWPDSTVSCSTEEREKHQSLNVDPKDQGQVQIHPEPKSSLHSLKTMENKSTSQFSRFNYKQKPKLQFLETINEASALFPPSQPKKRLYSQNSNYHIS